MARALCFCQVLWEFIVLLFFLGDRRHENTIGCCFSAFSSSPTVACVVPTCLHTRLSVLKCSCTLLYSCVWQVSDAPRVGQECLCTVVFTNPVDLVLTDCTLTLSGSGLLRDELECQ